MVLAHFEWKAEFFFHHPTAPKWLMQFSLTIPQGPAFPELLISAPKIVKADSEEEMGGRTKGKPFLKSDCCLPTSEDVIECLPYRFGHYKSKTLSLRETDHFSFINILAKLFKPAVSSADHLR